jgi:hypothetical protein
MLKKTLYQLGCDVPLRNTSSKSVQAPDKLEILDYNYERQTPKMCIVQYCTVWECLTFIQ